MKKILIVIDVQNDFIDGSLGSTEAQAIIPNVKNKIEQYIANGNQIIFTRDTHYSDYSRTQEGKKLPIQHCIRDTYGWQIGIKATPGSYKIINKLSVGYYDWKSFLSQYFNTPYEALDEGDLTIEYRYLCNIKCYYYQSCISRNKYCC